MKRISLFAMICLLSLPSKAPAPIFGGYPGLDELIKGAEFIVVAKIANRADMLDIGGGGTFEIEIVKTIKGNAKLGKASAYLRELGFSLSPPRYSAALEQGFIPGQLYLLFLNKPGTHTQDENAKPLPVDFENENCEGDAVWISSSEMGWFDVESLNGKSTRDAVIALLSHTATEQQKFASAVNAMIDSRSSGAITQMITQPVWVDDPEQAAKFYLSVFKHSRKDPNINQYTEGSADPKVMFSGLRLWIDGQDIVLLKRGSKSKTAEASALTLNCDLQEEIDYYWDKLSAGGEKSHAGWLRDKFGVWWHVVPTDLAHLLGGKYGNSELVLEALSKMEKIDSAALWRAAHPDDKSEQH
jgi:predicted 3-demethylubiquinone-9 3-methyltransferase (glyoxalase superfamily)